MNEEKLKNFIIKSNKIHKYKFNYSKFIYINSQTKGIIICPTHGEFLQIPKNHLSGYGCIKCGMDISKNSQRSNKIEFIRKSNKIHRYKFNYSLVEYKNANTKVKIICSIHGKFLQIPNAHLRGQGCPLCNSKRSNTKEFIKSSKKIHGKKFDYSNVKYINNYTKVEIVCPIHGSFFQTPHDHLHGNGCIKCRGKNLSKLYAHTKFKFIENAIKKHGKRFGYKKVIYKNNRILVIITCKLHGNFQQSPSNHLKGIGCPMCHSSKGEMKVLNFLKDKKIKFIKQKTFTGCINPKTNYKLRYDFYIPSKNLLIEYDGPQHFKPGGYLNGIHKVTKIMFKEIQQKDKIKTKFANQNKIRLLRIKYTNFNQIDKILETELEA